MRLLIALLSFGFIHTAQANVLDVQFFHDLQKMTIEQARVFNQLPWKVGDEADYKLQLGPLPGTMESFVREEIEEGFWIEQNVDVIFQQQKIEILFDKHTGEILQMLVNGEKQDVPDNDVEIISMEEDTITVPAGTFDVIHIEMKNNADDQISNAWMNLNVIPISGAAKQASPSQFGEVVMELTRFVKN